MHPLIPPSLTRLEPSSGALEGATGHYVKRFRDLAGIFSDADAFLNVVTARGEQVAYKVFEHRASDAEGDLIFGTSVLYPFRIGNEYAMTRGHIHVRTNRSEIYACQSGHGLLALESPEGAFEALEMTAGSVAYVPPMLGSPRASTPTFDSFPRGAFRSRPSSISSTFLLWRGQALRDKARHAVETARRVPVIQTS